MLAYIIAFLIFCCTGLFALFVYFANGFSNASQRSSPLLVLLCGWLAAALIAASHWLMGSSWW